MATQSPGFSATLADFAGQLLAQRELAPRARIVAEYLVGFSPDVGIVVYAVLDQQAPLWEMQATAGEIALQEPAVEYEAGTLGELGKRREPVLFEAKELEREDYAHLNVRRTIRSLAYIPLLLEGETLVGAVEVVSYGNVLTEESLAPLLEAAEIAAIGIAGAMIYENERNQQLESITRVTQMYDLEKVFNATREIDALIPVICAKFQEVLNAEVVNLWLGADEMLLTGQAGDDPQYQLGAQQTQGIAAEVAQKREPLLIADATDERLKARKGDSEGEATSLMCAPIIQSDKVLGVVEAINRLDGSAFGDDDLFLLTTICDAAAGALHNASLLQTERKVEILETLAKVSQEITSTLHLERVLQAVVDGPQEVIPYERASMSLDENGRLRIRAISGEKEVNHADPNVQRLGRLLDWLSGINQEIFATEHDDDFQCTVAGMEDHFRPYFAESGVRGFYCLPLLDEQGRVGMLVFESSDPDFLTEAHFEMFKVLAGQATVAIRNAQMYKEVPFIGLLEPLIQKKNRFMRLETRRRRAYLTFAATVAVFFAVFPLPMRVDGDASVAPVVTAQIQPETAGVVKRVLVREGDHVTKGMIIAEMEDWDLRAALAGAQAKRADAVSEMNRALASGDTETAGVKRTEADYWTAEVGRAQQRLAHAQLRSAIEGIVATPHIESFAGRHLEAGEPFAEVIDTSHAMVDIGITEDEAALLRDGEKAWVKLEAFPTQTFKGEVAIVSPTSVAVGDRRVYFARVLVPNPDGTIRAGMQGRGKVAAGWHAAGYVMFRKIFMWIWAKLWSWLPW
jgi:RND family efflux transporter MFP subunit